MIFYKRIKDKNGRAVYIKRNKTIACVFHDTDAVIYFNGGSVRVEFDEAERLGFKK